LKAAIPPTKEMAEGCRYVIPAFLQRVTASDKPQLANYDLESTEAKARMNMGGAATTEARMPS
jgi:hypothetical protein